MPRPFHRILPAPLQLHRGRSRGAEDPPCKVSMTCLMILIAVIDRGRSLSFLCVNITRTLVDCVGLHKSSLALVGAECTALYIQVTCSALTTFHGDTQLGQTPHGAPPSYCGGTIAQHLGLRLFWVCPRPPLRPLHITCTPPCGQPPPPPTLLPLPRQSAVCFAHHCDPPLP